MKWVVDSSRENRFKWLSRGLREEAQTCWDTPICFYREGIKARRLQAKIYPPANCGCRSSWVTAAAIYELQSTSCRNPRAAIHEVECSSSRGLRLVDCGSKFFVKGSCYLSLSLHSLMCVCVCVCAFNMVKASGLRQLLDCSSRKPQ